jgi:hypothetical protein
MPKLTPTEQAIEDLRQCLDGANIESGHPLIVSVLVCNRAQRMNLQGILQRIQDGKL